MSISELQQTFGVNKHKNVPDYHLLNSFKRINNKDVYLTFNAWNSSFLIKLKPNKLISPYMVKFLYFLL
jgi:hypothetical protein